jgi:multifunctional beta-oxidation protein
VIKHQLRRYVEAAKPETPVNQEILDNIKAAKSAKADGTDFTYDERDVILYSKF